MIPGPSRDNLALEITQNIRRQINRLFNGEITTPMHQIIYDEIVKYDRLRVEEVMVLRGYMEAFNAHRTGQIIDSITKEKL